MGTINIRQANEKLSQVDMQGLEERTACVAIVVDLALNLGPEKLLVQILLR